MDIGIIDRAYGVLDSVKSSRVHLTDRVYRAKDIVGDFFADKKNVRVRVVNGKRVYLVNGAGGTVYRVSGRKFSCTCPDHMQRGITCKHGIAVFAIDRAIFGKADKASDKVADKAGVAA